MKKMFLMLLMLLMVAAFCSAQIEKALPAQPVKEVVQFPKSTVKVFTGTVVRVKDGDTVVVLDSTKTEIVVRLAGVDAPEKAQPFGKVSKQFTIDQVALKKVTVTYETKDRYGRSVAWITYDNKNLSEELLKVGLAWHYVKYDKSSYFKYFEELQKIATEKQLGLWVDKYPIRPEDWRRGLRKNPEKA